jgi:tripartite-type tricarboxylate transporter receptor subunit TctC
MMMNGKIALDSSVLARRRVLLGMGAAGLTATLSRPSRAQGAWPTKPVRFIVPFPPGGSTDLMAREVAQGVGAAIGQTVIVENRAGAASTVGTAQVARSAPDGYTFLFTSSHIAIVPSLYNNLSFDPVKDFVPVSLVCTLPVILVANPSLPAKTVAEIVELSKRTPQGLTFGSSGNGGVSHLSGELFKSMTQANLRHVAYKGGGPAMTDLIGGHVNVMFDAVSTSMPHIKSGAIRPVAWTGSKRSAILPDLPTIAESGVAGYDSSSWLGLFAPAGTPPEIVQRVSKEVRATLDRQEVRDRQLALGVEIVANTPEEFGRQLAAEIPKWRKVVEVSGAKAD